MEKLLLRTRSSLAAVVVCAAALAVALVQRPPHWAAYALMMLAAGLAALRLYISARKKLISAQLIVENAILYIEPAVLRGRDGEGEENPCKTICMYVSVFGILLGGAIITWGQDGDRDGRLKAVEIGRDYLSIDYGTKKEAQNIRLLYARPDSDSLAGIVEKFRYETGIVPVVKNS